MNDHRIIGAIKEKAGIVQEGFGKLTGDKETELRGQGRRIEGQVEGLLGKAIDEARRFSRENPLVSLLAVGSVVVALVSALKGADRH